MTSKIVLSRKNQWINRGKDFKVFINGREVGHLRNNSSEEYPLEPGVYEVVCKLNWMSSPEHTVTLKTGENVYIKVSNGMKLYLPLYIMLIVGLLFPTFLKMGKVPVPEWAYILKLIFIVPALVYVILYMTLLRKRYLSIEEDKSNPFR